MCEISRPLRRQSCVCRSSACWTWAQHQFFDPLNQETLHDASHVKLKSQLVNTLKLDLNEKTRFPACQGTFHRHVRSCPSPGPRLGTRAGHHFFARSQTHSQTHLFSQPPCLPYLPLKSDPRFPNFYIFYTSFTGPTVTIVTSDFNFAGSSRWRMACRATEPFTLRRSLTTEGVMSLAWQNREPPLGCWPGLTLEWHKEWQK